MRPDRPLSIISITPVLRWLPVVISLIVRTLAGEKDVLLHEWHKGFLPVPDAEIRMHRLEVTQEVYALIAGAQPSRWQGARNSVEMVSWNDAAAFCTQATRRLREAGLLTAEEEVRLPSEQEWEHAARAGTTTAYSFGDDPGKLGDYGWFSGNAAGNDPPAGAKLSNPWGFFDFHGYVWEWCADTTGEKRIVRGGAWTSTAAECRSDSRKEISRETRAPDVGFRCVLAKVRR